MDQSQQPPPITHLLFNAGLQFTHEISYTEDGYKNTFAVNHLSHALLFSLLILHLILHLAQKACIVVTASRTHNPTQKTGMPDAKYTSAEELAHPTGQELNNASHQHYTTSKLVNMLWTYTLKQHLASLCGGSGSSSSPNKDNVKKDWTVAAFNPSLVPATGLACEAGSAMKFMWGCVLPKVLPLLRVMVSLNIHTGEPVNPSPLICYGQSHKVGLT